jgi:hypothetical protein
MMKKRTYNINLDPAVLEVNFPANIDIRDSVKYKNIMKSYKLGKYYFIIRFRSKRKYLNMFEHICSLVRSGCKIN